MPGPKYDRRFFDLAYEHDGLLTVIELKRSGISPRQAQQMARRGRLERVSRGVYRLPEYPADPRRQEYWGALLWPQRPNREVTGTLSHATALALHRLSDLIVDHIDVTLPKGQRIRRAGLPQNVHYHYAELPTRDTEVVDGLPVTTLRRTLLDCANSGLSARFVREALDEARRLGKIDAGAASRIEGILDDRG